MTTLDAVDEGFAVCLEAPGGKSVPLKTEDAREAIVDPLPRFYPRRCNGEPVFYGNTEALGWSLASVATGLLSIGAGVLLGPAFLMLARIDAGCEIEPPPGAVDLPPCDGKVYGLRPSSVLTTFQGVVGVVAACLVPLAGAVVDYTSHRRVIGRVLALIICALIVPFWFLRDDNWFPLLCVLLCLALSLWGHALVLHAYLPELTDSEDVLISYTKAFAALPYGALIFFLVGVLGIAYFAGFADDEILTARFGMIVLFVACCALLGTTWTWLMKPRPPSHTLQEGRSLWTAGFRQLWDTSQNIVRKYSHLKWFYIAIAFGDSKPLASIGLTYLTSVLAFTPQETGIAAILLMMATIPGCFLSSWFTRRFNPIRSSIVGVCLMGFCTALASLLLVGPADKIAAFALTSGWGMAGGWLLTVSRMLSAAILHDGQDAELMGFYLFSDQVLSWLPSLTFTLLNEAGLSPRISLLSIDVFFAISIVAYFLMGDYNKIVVAADRLHIITTVGTSVNVANKSEIQATVDDCSSVNGIEQADDVAVVLPIFSVSILTGTAKNVSAVVSVSDDGNV